MVQTMATVERARRAKVSNAAESRKEGKRKGKLGLEARPDLETNARSNYPPREKKYSGSASTKFFQQ